MSADAARITYSFKGRCLTWAAGIWSIFRGAGEREGFAATESRVAAGTLVTGTAGLLRVISVTFSWAAAGCPDLSGGDAFALRWRSFSLRLLSSASRRTLASSLACAFPLAIAPARLSAPVLLLGASGFLPAHES